MYDLGGDLLNEEGGGGAVGGEPDQQVGHDEYHELHLKLYFDAVQAADRRQLVNSGWR